jgi:hypothetical protein
MPKLSGPNLSDSQAGANVSNDDCGVGDDNEDWVLWDKLTMISVNTTMCLIWLFLQTNFTVRNNC